MTKKTLKIDEANANVLEADYKKMGYSSKTEYLNAIVASHVTGQPKNQELTIKQQIEKAKLNLYSKKHEILEQDLRIKKCYADNIEKYFETFGKMPSNRGLKALESNAKSQNKPYPHRAKNNHNEFVQRKYKIDYFQNDSQPYKALCLVNNCEILFEGIDRQEVTDDVCWHIEEIHKQRAETVVSTH